MVVVLSHVPGFAAITERAYAFLRSPSRSSESAHQTLWGPALQAERYALVSWVFLRLFGAIYVAAFASLGVQILGLIGHVGILPASDFEAAHQVWATRRIGCCPRSFG